MTSPTDPAPDLPVLVDPQGGLAPGQYVIRHRCPCGAERTIMTPCGARGILVWTEECDACRRTAVLPPAGSTALAGCSLCEEPSEFKPSHLGSPGCRSGSLASGGTVAHCTCSACF